jgi:hypothetical protein
MTDLLPCPWCKGSKFKYAYEILNHRAVSCMECLARGPFKRGAVEADKAWNIRANHNEARDD